MLNSDSLVEKKGGETEAIEYLVDMVMSDMLEFPYHKNMGISRTDVFSRLTKYEVKIDNCKYHLSGYHPRFRLYFPLFFSGAPTTVISTDRDYDEIDIFPDLYNEQIRIKQNGVWNFWKNPETCRQIMTRVIHLSKITPEIMRTALSVVMPEPFHFRTTWSKSILKTLIKKLTENSSFWEMPVGPRVSVLDLTPGWGETLLASISLGCNYQGYVNDNVDHKIVESYKTMIQNFDDNSNDRQIITNYNIAANSIDIAFAQYDINEIVRLIRNEKYSNHLLWLAEYLFPKIAAAWRGLREGGFFAIHLTDTNTCNPCEAMNLFMEQYLNNSHFEGIIGLIYPDGLHYPVWVWKKVTSGNKPSHDSQIYKRPFCLLYPELKDYIILHDTKHVDMRLYHEAQKNRKIVNDVISKIIDHIPEIKRKNILAIVSETMILTFVQNMGIDKSVTYIITLIEPWMDALIHRSKYQDN